MKKVNILITVPHSTPLENFKTNYHIIDIVAFDVASNLKNKLNEKLKDSINIKLLNGNINRTICDLNRKWCFQKNPNLTFFQNFIQFIEENKNDSKNLFILDIHSYPKRDSFLSNQEKKKQYDFVIIDYYLTVYKKPMEFLQLLKITIEKNIPDISIGLLGGSDENFIINHSLINTNYNSIACLFEFYEYNTILNNKIIDIIVNFITKWIKK